MHRSVAKVLETDMGTLRKYYNGALITPRMGHYIVHILLDSSRNPVSDMAISANSALMNLGYIVYTKSLQKECTKMIGWFAWLHIQVYPQHLADDYLGRFGYHVIKALSKYAHCM
jgi:hypothetical protein